MPPRRLIVGVDCGCSYTSVSLVWSDAKTVEDVQVFSKWGIKGDPDMPEPTQIPSKLAYSPTRSWGIDYGPGAATYSWSKSVFDDAFAVWREDMPVPTMYSLRSGDAQQDKMPKNVVLDSLTLLYGKLMAGLKEMFTVAVVDGTPIDFWFTMPESSTFKSIIAIRDATERAGFGSREKDTFRIVREPEAGAVACLSMLLLEGPHPLVQSNKGVLVCDCSGNSVRLSSYELKVSRGPLQFELTSSIEASRCGSLQIDEAFKELLRTRFEKPMNNIPTRKIHKLMQDFDAAKRKFQLSDEEEIFPLEMKFWNSRSCEHYDDKKGEILLTSEDMRDLFDPVIANIIKLITRQVRRAKSECFLTVDALIMVGGLSESSYVDSMIEAWCPEDIAFISPPNGQEAISMGAAVRGLWESGIVQSKRSRSHLGFTVPREYLGGIDKERDAYTDYFDGKRKVKDRMDWVIARGEKFTNETIVKRTISKLWYQFSEKRVRVTLYQSDSAIRPPKKDQHSVSKVAEIIVNLESVDLGKFESNEVKILVGKAWEKKRVYNVVFQLVMTLEDDLGHTHFHAIVNGRKLRDVQLKFIADD